MYNFSTENMKIIIYFVTSFILMASAGIIGEQSPRSVNVALETSFLFEPQNLEENLSLIQNIKVFLDKLYDILTSPQVRNIQHFRSEKVGERRNSFSEFLDDAGKSIMNFTSNKIHDSVDTISKDIVKFTEKSKKAIYDVMADKLVKDSLRNWVQAEEDTMKYGLDQAVNAEKSLLRTVGKTMNNYYSENDVKTLRKLVKKFNKRIEKKKDPTKVIYDILNFGVVDKYRSLNYTSRMSLMRDALSLLDFASKDKKPAKKKGKRHHKHSRRHKIDSDSSSKSNETNEKSDNEKKDTEKGKDEKIKIKDKNGNELVVDNVELFIKALGNT